MKWEPIGFLDFFRPLPDQKGNQGALHEDVDTPPALE